MLRTEQWHSMAQIWEFVKAPLRPQKSETDFLNQYLQKNFKAPLKVLILGVTRELFKLNWPTNSIIESVDKSQGMIDELWLGKKEQAFCDNWLTFKGKSESYDIILCDGGLHLVNYPDEQSQLLKNIYRLLKKEGVVSFRFFTPPLIKEPLSKIFSDLHSQKIENMSQLKLRLLFALHEDSQKGVNLASVWNTLAAELTNLDELQTKLGWSLSEIATIFPYEKNETKYHLSSLAEVIELMQNRESQFKVVESFTNGKCPILIFQKLT